MLVRLLYVSRAADAALNDLDNILQHARNYNAEHGITGALCYSSNIFMQVLEGSRTEVNRLYATILRDPHQSDVELLHYEEISERSYGSFSRSFDLTGIRVEDIAAAYENGVLKLTMPKKQETLPTSRKLEIA